MWDLPGTGIELVSPALSGGFLTTGPPGKSQSLFLIETQNSLILLLFAIWHLGAGFPRPPAITGATGFKSQILALSPHLLTSARWGFRFDTFCFFIKIHAYTCVFTATAYLHSSNYLLWKVIIHCESRRSTKHWSLYVSYWRLNGCHWEPPEMEKVLYMK